MAKKYLNEHSEFKDLIKQTADKIGLNSSIIEKDYWVTRILRELDSSEFSDEFIFKGGTSLSKIWFEDFGRFSEDIDILLTTKLKHRSEKSNRLNEVVKFVSSITGLDLISDKSTNIKPDTIGGKFYYDYSGHYKDENPVGVKSEILLEPGYRGGNYPVSVKKINSFLADTILEYYNNEIISELKEFEDDIKPFVLKVLSPERIFLEKLDAVRNAHLKNRLVSATRHYYDLYHLINLKEIQDLKENKELIDEIVQDISEFSKTYYGAEEAVTINDFKICKALSSDYSQIKTLIDRYKREKGLYYKNQPDFEYMLKEISDFLTNL